jgi:hypothetical protein
VDGGGHLVPVDVGYVGVVGDVAGDKDTHGFFEGVLDPAGASSTDKFRITAPPASGDDLPHSVFTRKTRHRFDYSEEDRGKHVYFCLRYENSKGSAGPWGPILSAVIP